MLSAAVSTVVNAATTYVAAKAAGQEYTVTDLLVSAAVEAVNAIPGVGKFAAGAISGAYSAYTAIENGATPQEAAMCFGVSAVTTTVSIGNLANLGTETVASVAATASSDLAFGTGYNCVAAVTNKSVSIKAERRNAERNSRSKRTHVTSTSRGSVGGSSSRRRNVNLMSTV